MGGINLLMKTLAEDLKKAEKIMLNFEYYNPTKIIFGQNALAELNKLVPENARSPRDGHLKLATTKSVRITKIMLNNDINKQIINMLRKFQLLSYSSNQSWKLKEQSPLMSLRCLKSMVCIETFSFFSKRVNHYRTNANILSYAITA